ncbi:purine and uridine phosphorylase [Glonium stellatum]|uniref:Purine and uridine phosphorylase n=1 Tax=Glonium stellatum TaxID=574774 RepID=A0A8E2ER62_9PEZI|nr:purine and uridine phosphorylase [Glonium stellatum]
MTSSDFLKSQDYTVGWICALSLEISAALAMLDEHYSPSSDHSHNPNDINNYSFGRIGSHNVVITVLPAGVYGTNSAVIVANCMKYSFGLLRFYLMVGIGGGAPSAEHDIRLGDVVVSKPGVRHLGVLQYDSGKTGKQGDIAQTGTLNKPPQEVLTAIAALEATHRMAENQIYGMLSDMIAKYPLMQQEFSYQGSKHNALFKADYHHKDNARTCKNCDANEAEPRPPRNSNILVVYYGLIASGNQVIKDAITRNKLRQKFDMLCFEMEAAGLMDNVPCLVVRGICDYLDSHKNNCLQGYAAATAAAYAKELLLRIIARTPSERVGVINAPPPKVNKLLEQIL